MSLLVKICGLSTPETLDVALDAGADMVGFVFFPPIPRNVSLHAARELGARVKAAPRRSRSPSMPMTRRSTSIVEVLQPDLLQLHGKETPARVGAIRQRFGLPVMKVLAIETKADLGAIPLYTRSRRPAAVRRARAARGDAARAGSASRSTGTCSKISTYQFHSCFPAASMPANVARGAARSRARPASTSRPASKARPA